MPLTRLLALLLVAGQLGCASLPPPVDKPHSSAFAAPQATTLGRIVEAAAPRDSASGFRLLIDGEDALASLLALADHAERSLDVQYYIVRDDASSRTVLRRVHAAAARGVRVRMLFDDLNTAEADNSLLCLTRHPNIELRLYNPFPAGRFSTLTRVLASLTDIDRVNQRMHAKMFVADNALAITGGRNLGDEYFVLSPSSNFVDLDLLVAGPVVPAMSRTFDQFWNDELAYPIAQLVRHQPECEGPVAAQPAANRLVAPSGMLARELSDRRVELEWARASVVADSPPRPGTGSVVVGTDSIASPGSADGDAIAVELARLIGSARKELVIVTPYFVPGPHGMAAFRALRERGVAIRVLTNSLASTDAAIVHVGYARYRTELLETGVELHELRPQLGAPRSRLGGFGSSMASLHAKALIIDRHTSLIGSMNMDPRSVWLNSELAIVIPDEDIAAQVLQLYEEVVEKSSYRLRLDEDGNLQWIGGTPQAPVVEGREPGASIGLRALLFLLGPFAPDEML
ncbi:MAG TPA: phospholipase D family protein [Burkholderiaceae bacterium]|nr:phospholipase D family protein [Burkholderiaceae bacterium]